MPLPDLTLDEHAELVRLVRDTIVGDRFILSPRAGRLRSILANLDPSSADKPGVTPYPAPRVIDRSHLLRKKRWR